MNNTQVYSYRAIFNIYIVLIVCLYGIKASKETAKVTIADIPLFLEKDSGVISRLHSLEKVDDLRINFHHKRGLHKVLKEETEKTLKSNSELEIAALPNDMVTAAFLVVGNDKVGEKVIMDTGSHLSVLTLPSSIANKSNFVPLSDDELHNLKKHSFEWIYMCPVMFAKGFSCGKERYGSGGINSVIGKGEINFRNPTQDEYEKNKEYYGASIQMPHEETEKLKGGGSVKTAILFQLNTLYGHSELGIFGLSFGKNGFEVNPFLMSLNLKRKNFVFQSKNSSVHEGKRDVSIKFGVEYQEKDYHWVKFTNYYKLFSMFDLYGVIARIGTSNRVSRKFDFLHKSSEVIFDSGTNVMVLPDIVIRQLVEDLTNIKSQKVSLKALDSKGLSFQLCWYPGNGLKILLGLENFALEMDLDLIGIYKVKTEGRDFICNYILNDSFGVVPVGYSLWHMFDVIWDSDMKRVGFKPGKQCKGNKCKIIKYD